MTKNLTKIYTRDLKTHTSFVMETLTHSVSFYVYPLWLVQKDSVVFIHGDYKLTQRVWKDFVLQNLVQYYDLYVQSDILLPPDIKVSQNLWTRPCSFPLSTRNGVAGMFEENASRTWVINRCWKVANGRKMHQE